MPLVSGFRLGVYEIVSPLGAGGMGEVFLARDTKLKRDVAIKVLPAGVTHDRERLARFRREAELLAALNHPNIAAVYGFEEAGDTHAIVMELAGGGTLADRLARQGRLPIAEALGIAREVADALEAIHDKGIVHRDLKPGNIAFAADGTVKVLDVGLAKSLVASAGSTADVTDSPTLTSPAMTELGLILGTAAYMSPEQAKARPADKRSDIWAFGCVLFEMLTGTRPFAGEDVSDTLAAVLRGEPDWSALPAGIPVPIRTLIERCLQKDRRKRIGDISTAIFLIDEPALGHAQPAAPALRRGERLVWLAASATLALAAAGVTYQLTNRTAVPHQVLRFHVTAPPDTRIAGNSISSAVSPDGRLLAFVVSTGNAQNRLAVRSLDITEARVLPGTEDATNPFWSPDSRFVAFFAGGRLKKVDLLGNSPQDLCAATSGQGGSWNADGTILFAPASAGGLAKVPQGGGTPVPVTSLDTAESERSHKWPWFLPDGKHFLFVTQTPSRIQLGSLDSPDRIELARGGTTGSVDLSNPIYSDGHILYIQDGTLIAQRFDVASLGVTGEAFPVARDVIFNPATAASSLSASATGVLSYRTGLTTQVSQLVWLDRSGKQLGTVGEPVDQMDVVLSRDGQKAAVSVLDPARNTRDIAIYDLARGGVRTRLTFDPADDYSVAWVPDGSRLIFSSNRKADQQLDLYQKAASGAGSEDLLLDDPVHNLYATDVSADGRFLFYGTGYASSATANDVYALRLGGPPAPPIPVAQTTFGENGARLSPDGRWVALWSNEAGGRREIFVIPFLPGSGAESPRASPARSGKWQISRFGGTLARWRSDGRELFYLSSANEITAVDVGGDADAPEFGQPRALFKIQPRTMGWLGFSIPSSYDASPDGRFLVNTVTEAATPPPITVVVNWTAGIEK